MPDLSAVTTLPRAELMTLCADAARAVSGESQRYSAALRAELRSPQRMLVAVRDHQAPRDHQPLTFEIRFAESPDGGQHCRLLSVAVDRPSAFGRYSAHLGYREFLHQLSELLRELDPDVVLLAGSGE